MREGVLEKRGTLEKGSAMGVCSHSGVECMGGVPIVLSRAQTDFFGSCRREFSTLVSGGGSS